MTQDSSSRLIAAVAALIVVAVAWDAFGTHRGPPAARAPASAARAPAADSTRAAPRPATASQGTSTDSSDGASYLEQLAPAETRRPVRASARPTYLDELV